MSRPDLSVVIPLYNCERFVTQALDSVLLQTYQATEIVVLDDGSTDQSVAVVQEYARTHPQANLRIVSQPNRGPGVARTAAIELALNNHVVTLDADDLLHPLAVERWMECALKHPHYALIYGDYFLVDEAGNTLGEIRHRDRRSDPLEGNVLATELWENLTGGINYVQRDKVLAVGGYVMDRAIFQTDYLQDVLLNFRLLVAGYEFGYVPAPLFYYRQTTGSRSKNAEPIRIAFQQVTAHLFHENPQQMAAAFLQMRQWRAEQLRDAFLTIEARDQTILELAGDSGPVPQPHDGPPGRLVEPAQVALHEESTASPESTVVPNVEPTGFAQARPIENAALAAHAQDHQTAQAVSRWPYYAPNLLIMLGAFLISVQFQWRILVGDPSGTQIPAVSLFGIATLSVATVAARLLTTPLDRRLGAVRTQFLSLLLGIGLTVAGALALEAPFPLSQLGVFLAAGVLLGSFAILFRARLMRGRQPTSVMQGIAQLWARRELLLLWTRHNVRARYSQAILGVIWVMLLPLLQALIIAFVFSQIIRVTQGDVPFVSFYLASLIPWVFINNGAIQGSVSVTSQISLLNQVYFPREILPLVKLGELGVDALFTFVALIFLNLLVGILPNANWIYLPILVVIVFAGTFGLALLLSASTVFIRDIPQLTFVTMQLLFYLTPILYPVTFIPEQLRLIVMLNPLVPVIEGFREVLVFNRPIDLISLFYPAVFALTLLYVGYSFFKSNERRLSDYV